MAQGTVRLAAVSGRTREERVRPMLPGGRSTGSKGCELGWSRDLRARIRQYLSFRIDPRSKFFPADHDADGTRMPGGRDPELRNSRFQWRSHAIAVAAIATVVCIGCKHRSENAHDAVYAEIEKNFISGDLSKASEQAQEAYRNFQSSDSEWASMFRIELAKVLIYQGKTGDALVLLELPLATHATIDAEVKRGIFLSISHARLPQLHQPAQT